MSETDTQDLGQTGGVESSYVPTESTPEPSQDGGRDLTPREGANELSDRRQEPGRGEDPPDIISYRNNETGKRTDRRATVSREQASKDLANYREQKVLEAERQEANLVRQHADALRGGRQSPIDARRQQPQQFAPAPQPQSYGQAQQELPVVTQMRSDPNYLPALKSIQSHYSESYQQLADTIHQSEAAGLDASDLRRQAEEIYQQKETVDFLERAQILIQHGESPKIAAALADRETLAWIAKATQGYEDAFKEAVAKHENNCAELIGALEAVLVWAFPELQGSARDVNAVIRAVSQRNPQRATDIQNGVRLFEQAAEKGLQARQRNEREKQEKFNVWAVNQDNIFRAKHPDFGSREIQKAVALEAFEMLAEKGIERHEVEKLHNEDILFRSAVGQEILWEALQFRRIQRARATLPDKRYRAPVQVLKPGVGGSSIEREPERLPSRFDGASGLRDAAAILTSRRAKRR